MPPYRKLFLYEWTRLVVYIRSRQFDLDSVEIEEMALPVANYRNLSVSTWFLHSEGSRRTERRENEEENTPTCGSTTSVPSSDFTFWERNVASQILTSSKFQAWAWGIRPGSSLNRSKQRKPKERSSRNDCDWPSFEQTYSSRFSAKMRGNTKSLIRLKSNRLLIKMRGNTKSLIRLKSNRLRIRNERRLEWLTSPDAALSQARSKVSRFFQNVGSGWDARRQSQHQLVCVVKSNVRFDEKLRFRKLRIVALFAISFS